MGRGMSLGVFTTVVSVLIVVACVVLVLCTLPKRNVVKDGVLTTEYLLGNRSTLDVSRAEWKEVPEELVGLRHLLRVGGTSLGKRHSGRYKHMKSGNRYFLYLTGKGEQRFFTLDGVGYLIDVEE